MTPDQLAAQIEALIAAARDAGLSDEVIADVLQTAADRLWESNGLPP